MKSIFIAVIALALIGILGGVALESPVDQSVNSRVIDFSKINPEFSFSAEILEQFEAEYIPGLRAINVYDSAGESQIYISFFKANTFLTLKTVDISRQDRVLVGGREAVLYEITKKDTAPNFPGQPSWRNSTHRALDIRVSSDSPTYFYSFAYNPNFPEESFNDLIDSLSFF